MINIKNQLTQFFKEDVLLYLFKMTLQMLKIWSQPVLDAWILVFSELLGVIKHSYIEEEINKSILFLSDKTQPTVSRYIAGRMIGIISEVANPTDSIFSDSTRVNVDILRAFLGNPPISTSN